MIKRHLCLIGVAQAARFTARPLRAVFFTADPARFTAQRRFIDSDRRLRPAGVRPRPRRDFVALAEEPPADLAPLPIDSFSSAAIAWAIRSRSLFNSETIDRRSNVGLLWATALHLDSRNGDHRE